MVGRPILDDEGNDATYSIKTPRKTPRKVQPKRKKYTAKVVREGKAVRTPKTPAKTAAEPTGKRKYTRKKKEATLNFEETPALSSSGISGEIVREVGDPCEPRCMTAQSVRRTLNFVLEDPHGMNDDIPSPWPTSLNFEGTPAPSSGILGENARDVGDAGEPSCMATLSVSHALNFDLEDIQRMNDIMPSPWFARSERQILKTYVRRTKKVLGSLMITSPRPQILKTYVRRKKKVFNSPDVQLITSSRPQILKTYVRRKKRYHLSVIPSSAFGETINENATDTQIPSETLEHFQRGRKRKRSNRHISRACKWYGYHDLERNCSVFFLVRKKRRTIRGMKKQVSLKNGWKNIYAIQSSYGTFTLREMQTSDCMPVPSHEKEKESGLAEAHSTVDLTLRKRQTSDCMPVLCQQKEKESGLAEAHSPVDFTHLKRQTSDCVLVLSEEEKESGLAEAHSTDDLTLRKRQTSDCLLVLSEEEKESGLAEAHSTDDFTLRKRQTSDCMPVLCQQKKKESGLAESHSPVDFTLRKRQTSDCLPVLSEEKEKESGLAEARSLVDFHKISPLTPEKAPGHSINQQKKFYGPQARIEALITIQRKAKAGRNKKWEGYKSVSSPVKKSPQSSKGKNAHHRISIRDVNDIVRMLKHLTIKDGYEKALVLYDPEDGKPGVQVDLDPESKRVWELWLRTGSFKDDDDGNMDGDRREWWEQERRVFSGRVDSFNTRVRLILGDRRFSRWGGSVLDSIVGVFLTQNVSDHLSSSAFMSLAARFPRRSNIDSDTVDSDKIRRSVGVDDTIQSQGAMSEQQLSDGGSIGISETRDVDKEVIIGNQFPECNHLKNISSTPFLPDGTTTMYQQKEWEIEIQVERNQHEEEVDSNLTEEVSGETLNNASKGKKGKKTYDWDKLRKQALKNCASKEQSWDTTDSLDYEAVRRADVEEVADAIKERGQHNCLALRIKEMLDRLVELHGSIDLEWLRDVPPEIAKYYLLDIKGLGLKSVECVRLLGLHHVAFPVDTNVCRISVRLGWVPLRPLPDWLKHHQIEVYPKLEDVQKYLWPRLCMLDQETLYNLHYLLITFGKVFCTKSSPNCNACPLRGECKHFASAVASARLALPRPEETSLVGSTVHIASEEIHNQLSNQMLLLGPEDRSYASNQTVPKNCEPIIEEPASPEPEPLEGIDIEDAFYDDSDEIPTIRLNLEKLAQNLQHYLQENNRGFPNSELPKALVAITPETAYIPMPKLKNVSRLRTEHLVYVLQDDNPLLKKLDLDKREPDDPCYYHLALWTPGETAQSIEPPKSFCNSQDGKLCDEVACLGCNTIREARAQIVRCTILIPSRTANRGKFPLNGTYFQVNELFADHYTSYHPINVPRGELWRLEKRIVYFGSSITSIAKGLTTEHIQYCFHHGYVCVRAYDRMTRTPKSLCPRLHLPAGKVTKMKGGQQQQQQQQRKEQQ